MESDESTPSAPYAQIDELVGDVELKDLRCYEVTAKRSDPKADATWSINVLTNVEPNELQVRCRLDLKGVDANYLVDAAAVFHRVNAREIPEPLVKLFAEKVGIMSIFPYLRTTAYNLASQLGADRPVLPLIRQGAIRLTNDPAE